MSILKSSFVVSSWTGVSRVMGFVRDIVIANKLGTSAASDAFFIAMLLPNLFRRLFAEGGFNVAFVPLLTQVDAKEGKTAAEEFAATSFTWLLLALLVVILTAQLFMPQLVQLISFSPTENPEKFDMAVFFGRITFPYLFFITLASLMGGICNCYRQFFSFSFVPILLNVAYLTSLLILPEYGVQPALAASVAIPAGGVLQAGFMVWALRRLKFSLRLAWPPKHPQLNDLLKRLGPAAITVGFLQFSFIIDTKFASTLDWWVINPAPYIASGEFAVSYLNYANKFYQFPLSMIGIAMATVLLPHFASALARKDHTASRVAFRESFITGMALAFAATAGLFVLGLPLMKTFFEHGDFTATSAQMSAWAMMGYCLGLPGYIASKITASAFYANGDTKTPVRAVAYTLVVNIIANAALIQFFGHVGIAVATAISGWVNASLQLYWLKKQNFIEIDSYALIWPLIKTVLLGAAVLGVLSVQGFLWPFGEGFILRFIWILSAVGLGGFVFIAGAHYGRLFDIGQLIRKVLKKPSNSAQSSA